MIGPDGQDYPYDFTDDEAWPGRYECGFAALPGNTHLWVNGICAVCRKPDVKQA